MKKITDCIPTKGPYKITFEITHLLSPAYCLNDLYSLLLARLPYTALMPRYKTALCNVIDVTCLNANSTSLSLLCTLEQEMHSALWNDFSRGAYADNEQDYNRGQSRCDIRVCPGCGGRMGGRGQEVKCQVECLTDWLLILERMLSDKVNVPSKGRSDRFTW
jgi:hypothetical protein